MSGASRQCEESDIVGGRFANQGGHRHRWRQLDAPSETPLGNTAAQRVEVIGVTRTTQSQFEFGPPGGDAVDRRLESTTGCNDTVVEDAEGCPRRTKLDRFKSWRV